MEKVKIFKIVVILIKTLGYAFGLLDEPEFKKKTKKNKKKQKKMRRRYSKRRSKRIRKVYVGRGGYRL